MDMPRYFGLDLHGRYVHGCEWTPDVSSEPHERHFKFANTPDAWSDFAQQLDRTCQVALEVTGNAFEVYDQLSLIVGQVQMANPVELKRLGSGRHTDRVDAARLAKMLALGVLPQVWVPPQPIRDMRRLLRYRERLGSALRRCATQAKAVLLRSGITLPRETPVERVVTDDVLAKLPSADRLILRSTLRSAESIAAEVHEIEAEIARRAVGSPQVQLLLTITGVGLLTAATIWATLGDPHRFVGPKQITRYAGLDASVTQSGEEHHHGRISKNGSGFLRTTLVEASFSLARYDTGPLAEFHRRTARTRGSRKAIVALARKLLIVAWRILCTGEVYRNLKPLTVARKQRRMKALAAYTGITAAQTPEGNTDSSSTQRTRVQRRVGRRTAIPA
jgi:transposase